MVLTESYTWMVHQQGPTPPPATPKADIKGMGRLAGNTTKIVQLFPLQVTSAPWFPVQHHPGHIRVKVHFQ